MILDDDHGGVFQLERSEVEISEGKETLEMTVKRCHFEPTNVITLKTQQHAVNAR